jgi:peptidyl-prolyl cis-trans isomerase D
MLDLFRKRGLTSIVYGIIIVATILVFVINFRPNANQKSASLREACVATVRGYCVDPKSHRASYRMLMPHDMQGNVLTERAKAMGLNKIALDGIIERELLVDEAERLGLTTSEDEVNTSIIGGFIYVSVPLENPRMVSSLGVHDGYIAADFRDKKTKQFDTKVYERNIRMYTGRSPQEFKEWQQRELLAAKMRDLIRAPIRVSEAEAFEMYVSEKSQASLSYVPVRFDWIEKYVIDASPKAAAEWAKDKTNASQIKEPEIRHILIKTEAGPDAGTDSKDKARAKAEELIGRIKKGEDFAALAKQYSQDPGSAMNGGELGTKTDGFVKPFKDAADALKGGQMTEKPVESQFGFHIIMKDDPTLAAYKKAKSLDAAKDMAKAIQAAMASGKSSDDAVKAAIAPYVKAAPAKKDAPKADGDGGAPPPPKDEAVTADTDPTRPQANSSSPFNKGGDPIPGLGMEGNSEVVKFAFSGAKDGDMMKDPLRADDGFYVVQIKGQKAATKDDFDKERDVYLQGILAAKQVEALSLYVRRLRETAKPDIKIDDTYLTDATGKTDGGAPAQPEEGEDEGP